MTRILVQPELLHQLSKEFASASHQINDLKNRLHGSITSLSWEVKAQSSVEEKWRGAHQLGSDFTTRSQEFSQRLTQKAQAFHDRDQEGVQMLSKAVAATILQGVATGALGPAAGLVAAGVAGVAGAAGAAALSFPQGEWKKQLAELGKSALTPAAKIAVLRTLINFTPGSNPNVMNISTKLANTKLASIYRNYIAQPINRYLPDWLSKKVPNSLSGVVKKAVGLPENFNRASAAGISKSLLKTAVKKFPVVSLGFNLFEAGGSIVDSYQQNKNLEGEQFWKKFSADSASAIWKASLKTVGGWAGTAAAVAVTWETGPGAIAAAIGGNYLGTQAGEWLADKTDGAIRYVAEKTVEIIPAVVDKTTEIVHGIKDGIADGVTSIKNGAAALGKKIDDEIKSLIKWPSFS